MFTRYAALLALLICSGCASTTPDTPATVALPGFTLPQVSSFSKHSAGEALPSGWQPWTLSRFKRPTEYRLVDYMGRTVVRARAESSASGLVHKLNLDAAN